MSFKSGSYQIINPNFMPLFKTIILYLCGIILLTGCAHGVRLNDSQINHQLTIESKVHTLEHAYKSMAGPQDNQKVVFDENGPSELLWVTGFKVEVVDADTNAVISPEYLCHSHLKFANKDRNSMFGQFNDIKLVTLIQGRMETKLPSGFGIPILSNELLIFHSMVINNNFDGKTLHLKVRTTFTYIKDKELIAPIKPLFRKCLTLRVPIDTSSKTKIKCLCELMVGEDSEGNNEASAKPVPSTNDNIYNVNGQDVSYHWVVPPGKHNYSFYLPGGLGLPYDTTVHYISIHIHSYGTFCALYDRTDKKIVFKSNVKNYSDRIGIKESEVYSSIKGTPVFKNHEYELMCGYNNTSGQDVDAMGVMYLYFLSKHFNKFNTN
jgi:hypothetical protein